MGLPFYHGHYRYVEENGDWLEYTECMEHFFSENEITDKGKKCSILLSVCGAKTYKIMRNLATLGKPGELAYTDLIDLVQNHHSHSSKSSVIVQHFKYHSHFRRYGDSISKFVAKLRQLEDMLRDCIVCGIMSLSHRKLELHISVTTSSYIYRLARVFTLEA